MTRKIAFFEGWSYFKFNNLGLALGTNLKFCASLSKGLKLKVRKFLGLIPTFVEVTGEKLVGGPFCPPPLFWIGLSKLKFPKDLVTFTKEICNGKLHLLCSKGLHMKFTTIRWVCRRERDNSKTETYLKFLKKVVIFSLQKIWDFFTSEN